MFYDDSQNFTYDDDAAVVDIVGFCVVSMTPPRTIGRSKVGDRVSIGRFSTVNVGGGGGGGGTAPNGLDRAFGVGFEVEKMSSSAPLRSTSSSSNILFISSILGAVLGATVRLGFAGLLVGTTFDTGHVIGGQMVRSSVMLLIVVVVTSLDVWTDDICVVIRVVVTGGVAC